MYFYVVSFLQEKSYYSVTVMLNVYFYDVHVLQVVCTLMIINFINFYELKAVMECSFFFSLTFLSHW